MHLPERRNQSFAFATIRHILRKPLHQRLADNALRVSSLMNKNLVKMAHGGVGEQVLYGFGPACAE
jgi:hypothetical protein